jgi:flagellar protein FlgJ
MPIIDSVPAGPGLPAGSEAPPAPAAADAAYRAQAQAAAEKFEAFFIAEMMKQMRRSARELRGDDSMFQDRVGDDMLEMADGLLADALSGRRAFGVADAILRQLLPEPPASALNASDPPVAPDP